MEEDIKNIEEMLEFKEDIIKYHAWVGTKLINSVENLLTRYKQLELENQALKNNQANCPVVNTSGFKCKLKQLKKED